MSFYHETQSTQTDGSKKVTEHKIINSVQFYSKRFDVRLIKTKLFEIVPDDEYWETLEYFVFGYCSKARFDEVTSLYLRTNESRLLHNDLIRAILFNAHYSLVPPPGIHVTRKPKIQKKYQMIQCNRVLAKKIEPMTLAELRILPSVDKLSERIRFILANRNPGDLTIDNPTIDLIYKELINFILYILKKTVEISSKDYMHPKDIILSVDQISHILQNDQSAIEIMSPKIFEKIAILSSHNSKSS
ncbi:hypothetical protein M9Y10_038580 [Tritrichomonas musculus]|uniref:Uncharacterized protein n=1 Tax=Tritrichomonas musculus TaxID=1915356 RepID=A0ABR2K8U3_9EUKA